MCVRWGIYSSASRRVTSLPATHGAPGSPSDVGSKNARQNLAISISHKQVSGVHLLFLRCVIPIGTWSPTVVACVTAVSAAAPLRCGASAALNGRGHVVHRVLLLHRYRVEAPTGARAFDRGRFIPWDRVPMRRRTSLKKSRDLRGWALRGAERDGKAVGDTLRKECPVIDHGVNNLVPKCLRKPAK